MRTIDADSLKKCAIPCQIHNGALTDLCVPVYQIDNAPTVVAENATTERPHGKWIIHRGFSDSRECSNCHVWLDLNLVRNSYCPNCGADMRGKEWN